MVNFFVFMDKVMRAAFRGVTSSYQSMFTTFLLDHPTIFTSTSLISDGKICKRTSGAITRSYFNSFPVTGYLIL